MKNSSVHPTLTEPQNLLVKIMRALVFGRIDNLAIFKGQPVFDPAPTVIRKQKLGGAKVEPTVPANTNCELRTEVIDLLAAITALPDGACLMIEVRFGLPALIEVQMLDPFGFLD